MFIEVGHVLLLFIVAHGVGKVGVRVLFTSEVFTGELFTVQSGMLRLSAVAVSSDVVPGHWDSVGLSNINMPGSQAWMSMIDSMCPAHWVGWALCMLCAWCTAWLHISIHPLQTVA